MLRTLAHCCLAIAVLCCTSAAAAEPPLRFGVFPRWNAQIMIGNFTPLTRALEKALGRKIQIESDKDFDSFMRRVLAGEFDMVHINQLQYIQARDAAGYRAIVKLCEQPSCTIRAQIVTRTDSGVRELKDLRGKRVAFGDRNALVSYLLARRLLQDAGLTPNDYRSVFTKNPPNALFAVYNGATVAAGVGSPVFQRKEITRRIDVSKLRVLAEGEPMPPLPIAVRAGLDPALVEKMTGLLLNLDQAQGGPEALAKIGATHFAAVRDNEYAALQDMAAGDHDVPP